MKWWLFPLSLLSTAMALSIDTSSTTSICAAAAEILQGEMNYYLGIQYGGTVGMFSSPYYWWQAGEAFGGWVDYYHFCASDNDTLKELLYDAMIHQAGSKYDMLPSNQSMTEGNDDQGVWGLTLLQAAERNFTDDDDHSWLSLAQTIYNQMVSRWDTSTCAGGLRWQIFTWNSGYTYKNSISNGCFFHIAARLYRYTEDERYLTQAEKVWTWMWDIGFMNDDDGLTIYDGADDTENCTDLTIHKWSYIYGVFLGGCAYLYNATEDDVWKTRVEEILTAVQSYFYNGTYLTEKTCAPYKKCNNDQRSFLALLIRNLGLTATLVPDYYDTIRNDMLAGSASAAAESCSGGTDGITCGQNWGYGGWDGYYGLGEQMNALEVVMSMITVDHAPLTESTGATSSSDPDAGNSTSSSTTNYSLLDIKTKDKAGAAILTAVVLGMALSGGVWMLF